MILASLIIIWGVIMTIPDEDKNKTINIGDILVGDTINIKGELFSVIAYNDKGVMEIENSKSERFYVRLNNSDIKFILHYSGSRRKYIEVKGTTGTVGSDYLDKIVFK